MSKKISILFVDDEPNILDGLRRLFHSMKNEWEIYYVYSGKDAIKLIEEKEIDIIFSDMKMPEIDGVDLLQEVKKLKPGMTRIILSENSDRDMILQASKSAHQFLGKPCNFSLILASIERVIYLKKIIRNRSFINIIAGIEGLPCVPELYFELEREINSPASSIRKVSEIVSKDISMTAKILQIVNSAFFGHPQPISNIMNAINYLGFDTVKSLVLFVKIFSLENTKERAFNINEFWNHSLQVAKLSQEYVQEKSSDPKMPEKAFIAGLLHDIGKLVLLKIPGYFNKISEISKNENLTFTEAEYKFFNTSHAEVGAYLLGLWGFPESIMEVIAYHHYIPKSEIYSQNNELILKAVHLANYFAHTGKLDFEYIEEFKADDKLEEYNAIVEKVKESYEQKNFIFR